MRRLSSWPTRTKVSSGPMIPSLKARAAAPRLRRPHVTAHAIQGDTVAFLRSGFGHEVGLSPGWSLGSGVQDLATAVLACGRVDAVGASKGAGFGILDEFQGAELVGATTESAAAFGLFTFRIGHGSTLG